MVMRNIRVIRDIRAIRGLSEVNLEQRFDESATERAAVVEGSVVHCSVERRYWVCWCYSTA